MKKIQMKKPKYNPKSDFRMNGKKGIANTIHKMIDALTNPEKAIETAPETKNTVMHSFAVLAAIEFIIIIATGLGIYDIGTIMIFGLLEALLYAAIVPAGSVLFSAMMWMFTSIMGGKQNFESQANAVILAATPIFMLASLIPLAFASMADVGAVLNLVLMLYALYSIGIISRKITELPTWKVAASVILALIVSFVLVLTAQTFGLSAA